MGDLERALRDDLDAAAARAMAVLDPIRVVIENYPEGQFEPCSAPPRRSRNKREFKFARRVFISTRRLYGEPGEGFFRLVPGGEMRLRHAFIIKCERIEKDATGAVTTIYATYDPATKSGTGGRNVRERFTG